MVNIPFLPPKKKLGDWVLKLRMREKYHRAKRNHLAKRAAQAISNGDKAEGEIHRQQAKSTEKTRMWVLHKIHKLEQKKAEQERKLDTIRTARIVARASQAANAYEANEEYLEALERMQKEDLMAEVEEEALDDALVQANLDPKDAERWVDAEIKSRIKRDVEPAEEARQLREQIKREMKESE